MKQDHVKAGKYFNLGVLYSNGKGVKEDDIEAKKYYDKSCEFGLKLGCENFKR